jgi:uncharacterized protein DUF5670
LGIDVALPGGGGAPMLLTIAIILLILWLLGFIAFHVTAWFIHVLIVIAIIVAILHFVRGPRAPA